MMKYHVPVLLNESISGLRIKPEGTYLDLTYGGGGHSKKILEKLGAEGKLISFDRDESALSNNITNNINLELIKSNFKFFDNHIKERGIDKVDGILADLGVSSHQIDKVERGFTYKGDTKLDMRMNISDSLDAVEIINTYDQEKLENIFFNYGNILKPRNIVREIIKQRDKKRILNNTDFIMILNQIFKKEIGYKLLSKFFQAIRIEVNDEINSLKIMLKKSAEFLNRKGRLVIISYHSLEDKIVKNFINKSSFSSDFKKDMFGRKEEFFLKVTKKPIVPSSDEVKINPRSRSAKLRIGERL
ncbi:MAG: 16S rRNA (cytosine(1402)-N(4))-methyltransferase [Flammeovirgaceae bacterium]|nr:16S rRNA (cytosine(1402)-N(4))-methyltransferase [Flammeovirgaceae bacterium]